MSAKYTAADLDLARRWLTEDVDPSNHISSGGTFPDAEDIAGLIADVREGCAGSPSELLRALAFLAARDGVGYRVEEIFARARSKGWEP